MALDLNMIDLAKLMYIQCLQVSPLKKSKLLNEYIKLVQIK